MTSSVVAMALIAGPVLAFGSPADSAAPSWKIVKSPNPAGARVSAFGWVSCTSATSCVAVGQSAGASGGNRTLIARWNGKVWSVEASPNPPNSTDDELASVSCTSATSCMTVGDYGSNSSGTFKTLAQRWDGRHWSIVPSPNPSGPGDSLLIDVSCSAATSCTAVGMYHPSSGGALRTLVERWNGTKWAIVASPTRATEDSRLYGVSCASATSCLAVGWSVDSLGVYSTLAERWNGTVWSIVSGPAVEDGFLQTVSCTSAKSCYAVGSYFSVPADASGAPRPLIERWDGTRFSLSPSKAKGNSNLVGVSCTSATSCVAVGNFHTGTADKVMAERWNGKSWAIVAMPDPGGGSTALFGVSCTGATSCFAVGQYAHLSGVKTLVERYS